MELPIYQNIHIDSSDYKTLKKTLKDKKLGKIPTIINIDPEIKTSVKELTLILEKILKELKINPFFPYPIYLITEEDASGSPIPVLKNKTYLPSLFKCKKNKISNKETSVYKKMVVSRDKILKINIFDCLLAIANVKKFNRELFSLTKEGIFYENIMSNLHKRKVKLDHREEEESE